jgi:hypothetical protein
MEQRFNKAYTSFQIRHRILGKTRGFELKIPLWLYIGVIRPMLMSMVFVHWPTVGLAMVRADLSHLQKLTECVYGIHGCFEVLFDLHLVAQAED